MKCSSCHNKPQRIQSSDQGGCNVCSDDVLYFWGVFIPLSLWKFYKTRYCIKKEPFIPLSGLSLRVLVAGLSGKVAGHLSLKSSCICVV